MNFIKESIIFMMVFVFMALIYEPCLSLKGFFSNSPLTNPLPSNGDEVIRIDGGKE